jgi:NitT/TauT family transport system ATP-binding protein
MTRSDMATASEVAVDRLTFDCRNVSVEFASSSGPIRVLEGVDITVNDGEFLSILGPSGMGKTTLLRILAGLQPSTRGSLVQYRGQEVSRPPKGVLLVFQDYGASLLPWRTVFRNVALGLEGRLTKVEMHDRVQRALALVGLESRRDDYIWQLSGGMQQRVQIARALAMEPEVLLMDEPFGALDAITKAQMQDLLLELRAATGITIVFVTHDTEEAVYLSDRVMVLAGRPARVKTRLDIDLPWPRNQVETRELPRYLEYRHAVYSALRGGDDGH